MRRFFLPLWLACICAAAVSAEPRPIVLFKGRIAMESGTHRLLFFPDPQPQTHVFAALDVNQTFTGNNTFTGSATISCNPNGHILWSPTCPGQTTLAQVYALCPAAPAPCYIDTYSNQTVTAGLNITGFQQPVIISGVGSDHNGVGGTVVTFTPATNGSTLLYQTGTASRLVLNDINMQESTIPLTNIVGASGTCTATAPNNTGLSTGNNIVVIGGTLVVGQSPLLGLFQNITVTGLKTFTFACSLTGTDSGGGLTATVAGPAVSVTSITGNGTTATYVLGATCPFTVGQTVVTFGSPTYGYNTPAKVVTCSGTGMTVVTALTTGAIAGGTVYAGNNLVIQEGGQGVVLNRSVLLYASGVQWGLAGSAIGNANYNGCHDSWSWFGAVPFALYQVVSGGVSNGNHFQQCTLSHAAVLPPILNGPGSENVFDVTEVSNALSAQLQVGDGTSVNRDNWFRAITQESVVEGPPSSQTGVQNNGAITIINTECAIAGGGTPVCINDQVAGASHFAFIGASAAPASTVATGALSGTGNGLESSLPNWKLDRNGNMALGSATLSGAGTPPAIAIPANGLFCADSISKCRFGLDSNGSLQGRQGASGFGHLGTTNNPVTDLNVSSNNAFAMTIGNDPANPPTAARTVYFGNASYTFTPASVGQSTVFTVPNAAAITVAGVNLAETFTAAQSFNSGTLLPSAAGGTDLGSTTLPFGNGWLGSSSTSQFRIQPLATAAARVVQLSDPVVSPANLSINLNSTNGFYQSKKGTAGCTTGAAAGNNCASAITVSWPNSFADTNYSATCTGQGTPTNSPSGPYVVSKANGSIVVNYFTITAAAASYPTVDCIAVHD